jgi:hypothetical protein
MLNLLNTKELGEYLYNLTLEQAKTPSVTSPSVQYKFGPNGEQTVADYIYPNVFGELPSNYTYTNDIADPNLGKTAFNITKANKEGTDWQDVIFDPAPFPTIRSERQVVQNQRSMRFRPTISSRMVF